MDCTNMICICIAVFVHAQPLCIMVQTSEAKEHNEQKCFEITGRVSQNQSTLGQFKEAVQSSHLLCQYHYVKTFGKYMVPDLPIILFTPQ